MMFRRFLLLPLALAALGLVAAAPDSALAAKAIPFIDAAVTSPDNHHFTIAWRAPGVAHVRIFAGTDPRHIGRGRQVAEGLGQGAATVAGLPDAPRWYFDLVPDHGGALVLADRSLHLTTAANFRDIGGYRTQDGKWVRMGLTYRSNELDHLSAAELGTLSQLGLRVECDLRTQDERQRGPDRVPPGVEQVSADVLADDADQIRAMRRAAAQGNGQSLLAQGDHKIYRDFVRLKSARAAYHIVFERLANSGELPAMFHCSAGKDRTGWGDAVLLTILGVPRPTILADYVLTDRYLQGAALANLRAAFPSAAQRHSVAADPADLDAAFDQVNKSFGTFDSYLHQGLGLDDADLRAIRKNFLAG